MVGHAFAQALRSFCDSLGASRSVHTPDNDALLFFHPISLLIIVLGFRLRLLGSLLTLDNTYWLTRDTDERSDTNEGAQQANS